ncbi:PHP domain-containing protein [Geodermatophilus sp. URMC 62]|uniref:PHP domain-containing protein n=1 Tax=Geodermatophilus sp. URMC 62 TaxID=3423414 RepID=UPI00406C9A0B
MMMTDNHVHSEWSYDTTDAASMDLACQRAVQVGLPAVAFTEHLDFAAWTRGDAAASEALTLCYPEYTRDLDITGYLRCLEACRARYPDLLILSGVEMGEPHRFSASVERALGSADFQRVLGSVHVVPHEGRLLPVEHLFDSLAVDEVMAIYFDELLELIDSSVPFQVLAHMDYPRRYLPAGARYRESDFEGEYRAVFRALAQSGRVLEINTLSPVPEPAVLSWWSQEGGTGVSFGSDAHVPERVGQHFHRVADMAERAGFRPGKRPHHFWWR